MQLIIKKFRSKIDFPPKNPNRSLSGSMEKRRNAAKDTPYDPPISCARKGWRENTSEDIETGSQLIGGNGGARGFELDLQSTGDVLRVSTAARACAPRLLASQISEWRHEASPRHRGKSLRLFASGRVSTITRKIRRCQADENNPRPRAKLVVPRIYSQSPVERTTSSCLLVPRKGNTHSINNRVEEDSRCCATRPMRGQRFQIEKE